MTDSPVARVAPQNRVQLVPEEALEAEAEAEAAEVVAQKLNSEDKDEDDDEDEGGNKTGIDENDVTSHVKQVTRPYARQHQ